MICPLNTVKLRSPGHEGAGGLGTRQGVKDEELLEWIAKSSKAALETDSSWVLSVCTGSALLAEAGVLKNQSTTSNKRAFSWVQSLSPESNINWTKQAR